ncbi:MULTISPECIES: hypothetical protein [Rhodopseudomonas]|uniref:N-acetyltransferase domain-containing protein n=1 Tax=Rhodopseudomonas palustris TaxID=1076 RepID=A0A0D7F6P5_RHOPL|nr:MULTISPECIES: hypothetical protein [Rhodopseudomonas]KIZ47387.1 hypothetical protein OO17_04575 [Rhodopseudomonas palustris]MDF3809269.1 hypothetical protein [Rhodopseudomonas sp. BAL398]WOK19047.1 hypothetical protein RBJ75_05880 [Rhodopseudomonas sp. BAL398]
MIRAVTPCPFVDVVDLYQAATPMKPRSTAAVLLQAARSESIGWYAGDRLIAAALFYPIDPERPGEDLRELVFVCLPDLARHLTAFIRTARLTRSRLGQDASIRIRAHVRSGHLPGARLARLCGLRLVGPAGRFDCWEAEGPFDERIRQRRAEPV